MARDRAHAAERIEGAAAVTSPFTVWEGGRDDGRGASRELGAGTAGDGLAVVLETPALFPMPTHRVADGGATVETCDATAAMPSPAPAPVMRSGVGGAGAPETERGLDWRLIGASLLLVLAMVLGAMTVRAVALDAAYEGLTWERHQVVAGESLESILAGRDLPGVGLGRLIDWVEERNGLPDATILPGQTLSIPVWGDVE